MQLKAIARHLWPWGYYRLGDLKRRVRILMYGDHWDNYFDASLGGGILTRPEACAVDLAARVPTYIDTIFIIGCAPGRDFIPFQGRYNLRGIDLGDGDKINWQCDTRRLRYQQIDLKSFVRQLERERVNLCSTLVYASGTLMLFPKRWQQRLYSALKINGCSNFVFQEAPTDHPEFGAKTGRRCFWLPVAEFVQTQFRDGYTVFSNINDGD